MPTWFFNTEDQPLNADYIDKVYITNSHAVVARMKNGSLETMSAAPDAPSDSSLSFAKEFIDRMTGRNPIPDSAPASDPVVSAPETAVPESTSGSAPVSADVPASEDATPAAPEVPASFSYAA